MGNHTSRPTALQTGIESSTRDEEQFAASLMLAEPYCRRAALESIPQGDIADSACRAVVFAIRQLGAAGDPIDPATIANWLRDSGDLGSVVSIADISRIMQASAGSSAHLTYYAGRVRDAAIARYLRQGMERTLATTGTSARDAAELLGKVAELAETGHQRQAAAIAAETPQDRRRRLGIQTGDELVVRHPKQQREVVAGLFRQGELVTLTGTSKAGKSWYALRLARAVSEGRPWLGRDTLAGQVLFLDFELRPETLSHRVRVTREDPNKPDGESLLFRSLRGVRNGWAVATRILEAFGPQDNLRLVVIDPLYAAYAASGRVDENDNVAAGDFMRELIGHCDRLGCSMLTIGHAAKGQTGGRALIDFTAGAGAFSRAADAILALRDHEQDDHYVRQSVCRSLRSPPDETIRVVFPEGGGLDYELAPDVEPKLLPQGGKRKPKPTAETVSGAADGSWSPARADEPRASPQAAAAALINAGHRHQKAAAADRIHEWFGVSKAAARGLVRDAVGGGYLREWDEGRKAFVGPPEVSNSTLPELG